MASSVACFLLAVAAVVSAAAMPRGAVGAGMAPGVLPLWIGLLLAFLSLLLTARALKDYFASRGRIGQQEWGRERQWQQGGGLASQTQHHEGQELAATEREMQDRETKDHETKGRGTKGNDTKDNEKRDQETQAQEATYPNTSDSEMRGPIVSHGEFLAVAELFLLVAVYVLAMDVLGFGSATVGMVTLLTRRLGRYAWWRCVLYGALLGATTVLVFRELLALPLPVGWSGF
ncbi:hypothetical protein GTO89_03085 [Heliobacterium gestii]|uniref:DUF1468 domain-containing protein n=1 Tax=Heliomicrobium gestii TaxID=2699 RepID=A0A845LBH8_HELGE|nr:tripartite tricarboxylate transporter TctB family protein [Heliomicrobium gestii]MBM7865773.1 hypothetical protein [Heliomicrobium gestii]MZP42019.1 hypothetical protein [Heliomicrobium gestii]